MNDLFCAAIARALGEHLRGRVEVPDDMVVKAVVPIDLRPPERLDRLGNEFGLVFLALPVGEGDPRRQLEAVRRATARAKRSAQGPLTLLALRAVGRTGARVEGAVVRWLGKKASLVMTNVIGPRGPRRLAGARIRGLVAWNPTGGTVGVTVSVLSFAGEVRVAVAADANLVPDPGPLADDIAAALR
jgi:hypothetical protein